MPDRDEFQHLANKVREIAAGIFDQGERETVLRFVDECEKRIGETARAGRAQSAE